MSTGDGTTYSAHITEEVLSWPGITAGYGPRGEWAFTLERRDIGHLHGDHVAHFAFPKATWMRLRDEGRITEHPIFPGRPGLAERRMDDADDVAAVIALLRLNYDRARARRSPSGGR